MTNSADARPLPRWWLAALSSIVAAVCLWSVNKLPWSGDWTLFATMTAALGVAHLGCAVVALSGSALRAKAWRLQALVALVYLAYASWNLVRTASYVAELYGGLGRGVAVSLGLVWMIVFAFTVPLSAWGLVVTGGIRPSKAGKAAGAALLLLAGWGVVHSRNAAAAEPVVSSDLDLDAVVKDHVPPMVPAPEGAPSLSSVKPAVCPKAPAAGVNTVVATFLEANEANRPAPISRCWQGEGVAPFEQMADTLVSASLGGRVKIDVITGVQPLQHVVPIVDSMLLRPGLDGVCEGRRCLMPWQMLALDAFNTNTPIPVIPDLRFGFDPVALRKTLAPPDATGLIPTAVDGLTRIETRSFVTDGQGALHPLRRMRQEGPPLTPASLQAASKAAEQYILSAQGPDGRFEYKMRPFSGLVSYRGFAIARQAGTTLVTCELADDTPQAKAVARRALSMLASTQRRTGELSMLKYPKGKPAKKVGLGNTALAAIAFLSCRDRVGKRFDDTIDRMTKFLLAMQRPDGSFYPKYDFEAGAPVPGPDPLYAVGQAIFALVLLEEASAQEPGIFADADAVHEAVDRAMDYIATDYWSGFVRDFFFMEENWNCLAARAALGHHRHEGYERFCLDYVRYKTRLILSEEDEVGEDLVGGYGYGNVLLPHNTGSAGFGEAGSAALALAKARGEDASDIEAALMRALSFLVHHQWNEVNCFACEGPHPIEGGFSEHMGSPTIRIDFVQHAWAGMGHSARALGWFDSDESPAG
ncbi:MAG: hypothetical protein AAGA54_09680 [Myxococcota bacterium]